MMLSHNKVLSVKRTELLLQQSAAVVCHWSRYSSVNLHKTEFRSLSDISATPVAFNAEFDGPERNSLNALTARANTRRAGPSAMSVGVV